MTASVRQQAGGEMTASVQQQGTAKSCCSTLAVTPMRNKGLIGWRYDCKSNYMITLVAEPRVEVFGKLCEWGVERSEIGKVVYEAWQRIESRFPGVRATYNSIMPEHFHGIVYITADGVADLREVVAAFAADVERTIGRRVWAELWRDSICLQRGQLHRQINYILSNAKRRWIKDNNPGLFRKVLGFKHWRLEAVEATLAEIVDIDAWDFRAYKHGLAEEQSEIWSAEDGEEILKPRKANKRQTAFEDGRAQERTASVQQQEGSKPCCSTLAVNPAPSVSACCSTLAVTPRRRIGWTALGNPFLLEYPLLVSVRISRRTPDDVFAVLADKILAKVERGAVLIGAWISPFEREVKRAAVERGGKVIELLAEGMGRYYKPGGEDFALCDEGRLLQISPFSPRKGGDGREEYGKPRFEWLNRAAAAIGDIAMGYAVG